MKKLLLFVARAVLTVFLLFGVYREAGPYTTAFCTFAYLVIEAIIVTLNVIYFNQYLLQKQNSINSQNIVSMFHAMSGRDSVGDTLNSSWNSNSNEIGKA